METITVYRDTYNDLQDREFSYMTRLAKLQGTIIALADIAKTNPQYVEQTLQSLAEDFGKKEVDL